MHLHLHLYFHSFLLLVNFIITLILNLGLIFHFLAMLLKISSHFLLIFVGVEN